MKISNNFHLLDIETRRKLCKKDGRNPKCAECRKLSIISEDKVSLNYRHFETWCNEKLSCKYGIGCSHSSDNFFEKDYTPKIRNIWK